MSHTITVRLSRELAEWLETSRRERASRGRERHRRDWLVAAFANRSERYHEWARSVATRVREPLLACEPVLAETAFHLGSVSVVLAIAREGLVTPAFDCRQHLPRLTELADRYADRKPDFADLCLIRMSELHRRHSVITVDRGDFRIYRRNKRETIPLICPPER